MATSPENRQPIIIKRIKKVAGGHHGGAWKVAYADFVTAMMAFFLLLWLLNATSESQKQGLADYFDPMSVSASTSGAGGVLGGQSLTEDGHTKTGGPPTVVTHIENKSSPEENPVKTDAVNQPDQASGQSGETVSGGKTAGANSSAVATPAPGDQMARSEQTKTIANGGGGDNAGAGSLAGGLSAKGQMTLSMVPQAQGPGGPAAGAGNGSQAAQAQAQALQNAEEQRFQGVAKEIAQAVKTNPDLASVANQVLVESTPVGLQIQLVDQPNKPMFQTASSRMSPELQTLLDRIAKIIQPLDNRVSIAGHTDATPYKNVVGYTNWELSADRANSARRVLVGDGLSPNRLYQVSGKADSEPLLPDNPRDAANRRITITLMREVPALPPGVTVVPATP